jgi:hypothetical protein
MSQQTFDSILDVLHRVGEKSTRQLPGLGTDPSAARQFLRRSLQGSSEARVKGALAALRRLQKFCNYEDDSWLWPDSTCLGGFLLSVSGGGPTAASGVWHHLDWWKAKFGLPFDTRGPFLE